MFRNTASAEYFSDSDVVWIYTRAGWLLNNPKMAIDIFISIASNSNWILLHLILLFIFELIVHFRCDKNCPTTKVRCLFCQIEVDQKTQIAYQINNFLGQTGVWSCLTTHTQTNDIYIHCAHSMALPLDLNQQFTTFFLSLPCRVKRIYIGHGEYCSPLAGPRSILTFTAWPWRAGIVHHKHSNFDCIVTIVY